MDLSVLTEAIDELFTSDPSRFADGESILRLHQQLSRLDGFTTMAMAGFETSGEWARDGARTAPAWVAARCRIPQSQARRRMRRGRALRFLPKVSEACLAGTISSAHVDEIVRMRRSATEDALARDEALLVNYAETLTFRAFTRALAYWEQRADPTGAEDSDEARRGRRDAYLVESFDGMWLGSSTLDPISGAIVSTELNSIESEFFNADWAVARERLGREPTMADLERTPGQRRADALTEMAIRSRTTPVGGRRPAPLFTVLVGYETLHGRICELAQGIVVSPGALVPWLEHADIERAVFGPSPRVEISATSRLFTGATRRGVEVRDRECTNPYCEDPEADCEIDHIVPWIDGGQTTQENGRVLCGYHNRLRNQKPPP